MSAFLVMLLIIGLLLIIGPFITMVTWNALITTEVTMALFGVAKLTLWKAFLLDLLSMILFKGTSVSSSSKS